MIFYFNTIYQAPFWIVVYRPIACPSDNSIITYLTVLPWWAFSQLHVVLPAIFFHLHFSTLTLSFHVIDYPSVPNFYCGAYCQWPSRNIVLNGLPPRVYKRVTFPTPLPKLDVINLFNFCQTERQRLISNFVTIYIRTGFSKCRFSCVFCSKWLYWLASGSLPYPDLSSVHCWHCRIFLWKQRVIAPSWAEGQLLSFSDIDSHSIIHTCAHTHTQWNTIIHTMTKQNHIPPCTLTISVSHLHRYTHPTSHVKSHAIQSHAPHHMIEQCHVNQSKWYQFAVD